MERKDIESVRKIFETQLANGNKFITLNALMFQELLEHAETHNVKPKIIRTPDLKGRGTV